MAEVGAGTPRREYCDQRGDVALGPIGHEAYDCEKHALEIMEQQKNLLWEKYQQDSKFLHWRFEQAIKAAHLT